MKILIAAILISAAFAFTDETEFSEEASPHFRTCRHHRVTRSTKTLCMGHNIKCFKASLGKCIHSCRKNKKCKMAEYKKKGTHCCLSPTASKKTCKGSWKAGGGWVGYTSRHVRHCRRYRRCHHVVRRCRHHTRCRHHRVTRSSKTL